MSTITTTLRAIHDRLDAEMTEKESYDIKLLIEMFAAYPGDDPEEAKARTGGFFVSCENCGYEWIAAFVPSPAARNSRMLVRGCWCPRCFATVRIMLRMK